MSVDHSELPTGKRSPGIIRVVERGLFNIRWVLIPFYVGLVAVLAYYGIAYFHEVGHFIFSTEEVNIETAKVFALDTIDIVMIANLIKMIITGSYNSFVSKDHGYVNENISSGQLKVKIATSVVVLSMINLLKAFVANVPWEVIQKQISIFAIFLAAALTLAFIEHLHSKEHK